MVLNLKNVDILIIPFSLELPTYRDFAKNYFYRSYEIIYSTRILRKSSWDLETKKTIQDTLRIIFNMKFINTFFRVF